MALSLALSAASLPGGCHAAGRLFIGIFKCIVFKCLMETKLLNIFAVIFCCISEEERGIYCQCWQRILNVSAPGYFWMGFLNWGGS